MADDDMQNLGLEEAHTPGEKSPAAASIEPDPERAAKIGSTRATTEAVMSDLAAQLASAETSDQPSLMLDEQDEQLALFAGPVAHVASTLSASRGRGRPKGSTNKANAEFRDILMRMGFRHPGLNLAAIANADPVQLAAELSAPYKSASGRRKGEWVEESVTPGDALAMILKANAELLPYFESKRPTEIHVDKNVLGVMIVGEMAVDRGADTGIIDLTKGPSPE